MTKIHKDYIYLKKNIASYIDKYPQANRKDNQTKLERLRFLQQNIDTSEEAKKEYDRIRHELTISNGGFAMTYVTKYGSVINENTSISELFQEATIGIIESIDTFDLTKNTSFTTYAFYHIRKRLIDYIKKNKLVKAPRDIARNIKHVTEIQEKLTSKFSREPSAHEIKKSLLKEKGINLKEDIITDILILLELNSAGHENTFISEYTDQLSCEDYDSTLFRGLELNILSSIKKYTQRQQRIIKLRFGIGEYPHTIDEIKLMMSVDEDELKKI